MVLSKDWLHQKKQDARLKFSNTGESYFNGKCDAFQECYDELVKPPVKNPNKKIDTDKAYGSIVEYYIKKGYTKEHANEIAMKAVADQKQKVLK